MTKLIDRIAIFVLILSSVLAFIDYHDDLDWEIPYLNKIMMALAGLLTVLLIFKAVPRLQSLFLTKKVQRYYPISSKGKAKSRVYEGVSLLFLLTGGFALIFYSKIGFMVGVVALIFVLEGLITLFSGKHYKIIFQSRALTIVSNYVDVIRWQDIEKIENKQGVLHFVLTHKLIKKLDLDYLNSGDKDLFVTQLKDVAKQTSIYIEAL